jgi:hypothetical protein
MSSFQISDLRFQMEETADADANAGSRANTIEIARLNES